MNQASKLTKESIVEAYNQLVSHQGKLIGERVFMRETGISHYHWKGGLLAILVCISNGRQT